MKREKSKTKPKTKLMHPVIQGFVQTLSRLPKALPKARGVPIDKGFLDSLYVRLQELERMAASVRYGLELNYKVSDELRFVRAKEQQ
jgi:hypothetical protein